MVERVYSLSLSLKRTPSYQSSLSGKAGHDEMNILLHDKIFSPLRAWESHERVPQIIDLKKLQTYRIKSRPGLRLHTKAARLPNLILNF